MTDIVLLNVNHGFRGILPAGSYTTTVPLGDESLTQADSAHVFSTRPGAPDASPPESLALDWPGWTVILRGKLQDPSDRRRLIGGTTDMVARRIGPDADPWLFDHYAAAAQDGSLHPVRVTSSWNVLYRP